MKSFYLFNKALFVAVCVSGCTYAPPARNYVLAKRQYNLMKKANSIEFAIAKSVFDVSKQQNQSHQASIKNKGTLVLAKMLK